MDVKEKVRNAIERHEAAVRNEISATEALEMCSKLVAETARELSRVLSNHYPGRGVIHNGNRYQVAGERLVRCTCTDVIVEAAK